MYTRARIFGGAKLLTATPPARAASSLLPLPLRLDPELVAVGGDLHVAVEVGAEDGAVAQPVERLERRVAVAVVLAERDDGREAPR